TSATRWQGLPDVPTVGDVFPGYEVTSWLGIGAPKSTPAQIVDKLNQAINAGLADAKLNARLAELGGTAMIGSPADFGKLIADETEKWGKVIRAANIKPEGPGRHSITLRSANGATLRWRKRPTGQQSRAG